MANVSAKVGEMSFKDAAAALVQADKELQTAKAGDPLRKAALAFATAERHARSAKARESDNVLSVLESPKAK